MNRPPTICLFCGQPGNMSKQHIFPDRLKRVLPRDYGLRLMGSRDLTRNRGRVVSTKEDTKTKPGSISSSKLRKVCKRCNEGWLNLMEQESVPVIEQLITGDLTVLRPPQQVKLASLATSMAMVGEWLHAGRATATQGERNLFRETLRPPPGWYAFVGKNGWELKDAAYFTDGCTSSNRPTVCGEKEYSSYTMIMGPVLLHVISLREGLMFDVDQYAHLLGLAAICPQTDWISFGLMPVLTLENVAGIRAYARAAFRNLEQ